MFVHFIFVKADTDIVSHLLVVDAASGNRQAARKLVDIYSPRMMAVAHRYLGNTQDAEDALQNAWLNALSALSDIVWKGESSFKSWLMKIVANEALSILKRSTNLQYINESDRMDVPELVDESQWNIDHVNALYKCLNKLPQKYRLIINMYVFDGFSHAEIAEKLNITVTGSQTRLSRGKSMLAVMLKMEGVER